MPQKIAIMQPYFFPYAGYFRLMEMVDLFVVFDCIQFNRNGWLHRNLFEKKDGTTEWFTLPLVKGPRDTTKIKDLKFRDEALELIHLNSKKYMFHELNDKDIHFYNVFSDVQLNVTDYLINCLKYVNKKLDIEKKIIKSSELQISENFKGQHRIIEIIKKLGYSTYINAPGGIHYYDQKLFQENRLKLIMLKPYIGPKESILDTIRKEGSTKVIENIRSQCKTFN